MNCFGEFFNMPRTQFTATLGEKIFQSHRLNWNQEMCQHILHASSTGQNPTKADFGMEGKITWPELWKCEEYLKKRSCMMISQSVLNSLRG